MEDEAHARPAATGDALGPGTPLIDAEATRRPAPRPSVGAPLMFAVGLLLIALNLRIVFTSLAAVLPEAVHAMGLTAGAVSLLTTLPVLCMGVFAPISPYLASRLGSERTLALVLVFLAIGTALRGVSAYPAQLLGAAVAGGAIAVGNVLVPGLIKRDFPNRLALMTGLFTLAMCVSAALGAGLTVPLTRVFGGAWNWALAAWALPAVPVLMLWAPQAGANRPLAATRGKGPRLWRSGLAWHVTLFMGLQSALAYCVFGYLSPILRERGVAAAIAGDVTAWLIFWECVACLLAPSLAMWRRDQRFVNAAFFVLALVGLFGCLFAPLGGVWLWSALTGLGQGGLITLAVTAIVLRSPDARIAAQLSGMAQSVGYVLASGGPWLIGYIRGVTGSYAPSAIPMAAITAVGIWAAVQAGRDRQIAVDPPA